jgi:DNA-binding beta-propeller fold protein YncE
VIFGKWGTGGLPAACRRTVGGLCAGVVILSLAAAGCASKWVVDARPGETGLVWPKASGKPRVRHLATIRGFKERGMSLSGLVFGKGESGLVNPVAVAAGRDGRIAVADTGAKAVHLYVPGEGRYVRIVRPGSGEIESPVSVAFDGENRLYVSDSSLGKVFVFGGRGDYLFSIGGTREAPLARPTGLAYDRDEKAIFVVDTASHRIHAFSPTGEPLLSFGGRGGGDGRFNFPTHVFRGPAGRIYVTDAMNFRIQMFDSSGAYLASFGRHGDGSGDFSMPKGVASDSEGTVYVADTLFDNIQLFDERGEFLLTLGGRGTGEGEFWMPSGIFIDGGDRLYVCDTYNRRVQVFEIVRGGG